MYAFTELHNDYPAYVNLSEQPDGAMKLAVRQRGNGGKDYATIILPNTQAEELAEAIFKHVRAADAPPQLTKPEPGIAVKVERNRVWIVKGAQSFMLAYEAGEGDEPEEIEWYANQLRTALSIITPCVKSDSRATATNTNQPENLGAANTNKGGE